MSGFCFLGEPYTSKTDTDIVRYYLLLLKVDNIIYYLLQNLTAFKLSNQKYEYIVVVFKKESKLLIYIYIYIYIYI